MTHVLLDTHAWAWSLTGDPRLPDATRRLIAASEAVFVSPVSLFEIGQKVRLGKWPELAPHAARLADLLKQQGLLTATLTPEISLSAALLAWPHRDPFDRILAATAIDARMPLVSTDDVFDQLAGITGWAGRLW